MYTISIYPTYVTGFGSLIAAGLFELRSQGALDVRFSDRPPARISDLTATGTYVWLRLLAPGVSTELTLCFDMIDGSFIDHASLDAADIYFKRGYLQERVDALPASQRHKVQPFGLEYPCRSRHQNVRDAFREARSRRSSLATRDSSSLDSMLRAIGTTLLYAAGRRNRRLDPLPLCIEQLEAPPDDSRVDQVFFSTRCYAPEEAPGAFGAGTLDAINETRASTIRALKTEFGSRFAGGLRRSDYALARYPDCVSHREIDHASQIRATRSSSINVTTSGLHGSTGWKTGEILAASACLVSEPLLQQLPVPLVEGKNYLAFRNADESVAACVKLFEDRSLAERMRHENHRYYRQHVRPDRAVQRCLEQALSITRGD